MLNYLCVVSSLNNLFGQYLLFIWLV
uniref:Uncharacterized protein n=1 Tax=Arundo donax TaxID=35708 RepID=A0A0A9FEP0_ARUDO